MRSKPKLNSGAEIHKGLEDHLRASMIQCKQIPKVERKKWWEVLTERIKRVIRGR
jgi:hypothetical protein